MLWHSPSVSVGSCVVACLTGIVDEVPPHRSPAPHVPLVVRAFGLSRLRRVAAIHVPQREQEGFDLFLGRPKAADLTHAPPPMPTLAVSALPPSFSGSSPPSALVGSSWWYHALIAQRDRCVGVTSCGVRQSDQKTTCRGAGSEDSLNGSNKHLVSENEWKQQALGV